MIKAVEALAISSLAAQKKSGLGSETMQYHEKLQQDPGQDLVMNNLINKVGKCMVNQWSLTSLNVTSCR